MIGLDDLAILHSTSAYPCDPQELNLKVISTLKSKYDCPIGYSGHEVGLIPSVIAVGLGASIVERHFTLDRAMWGGDQAASVEPGGFRRLVKYIRVTEMALGDGVKRVYDSEKSSMKKLRRYLYSTHEYSDPHPPANYGEAALQFNRFRIWQLAREIFRNTLKL